MTKKRLACVFDLDGTLDHGDPVQGGFPIRGRTTNAFLAPETLERLWMLSRRADIFIATGRSHSTVRDFRSHFEAAGVGITGWILEHGAVVPDQDIWTREVLEGIDLHRVWDDIERLVQEREMPIDCRYYRPGRKATVLLSGRGALLGEHLLDLAAGILDGRFRSIVGRRKLTLIPLKGDKYKAFSANFGDTHTLAFAAGDQPDDLTLLQQAAFPVTVGNASPLVKEYVRLRGGFVADASGHQGTVESIDAILRRLDSSGGRLRLPGFRLPVEEAETYRPSRRAYLDLLFDRTPHPAEIPDTDLLTEWSHRLNRGRGLVLEVRMRDWGGEIKPLRALLNALTPFFPDARWRLGFRPERIGVENLCRFSQITERLSEFEPLPDGSPRLSAPGVDGSPVVSAKSNATILLYDYPEDLDPWAALALPRLITRHPRDHRTWFANPMHLKIIGAEEGILPFKQKAGPGGGIMMAANVIGPTDIRIAAEGFRQLRDQGLLNRLIIAPRVITNPERNRMIQAAVAGIGEGAVFLSRLKPHEPAPRVLVVDTYGDLDRLYKGCAVTYLGGGFNPRKRGFDPMESLVWKVPVLMGPVYDYNRVSVDGLKKTGWITVLPDPTKAAKDFSDIAERLLSDPPDLTELNRFVEARRMDPLRAAAEIMADLCGVTGPGGLAGHQYWFAENRFFAQSDIDPEDLAG